MDVWVFGYGSLVWRPGFVFEESCFATLEGWRRSFQQGSPDHRGTLDAPGRVLTICPDSRASCIGKAFRILSGDWPGVFRYLEERESGGYQASEIEVQLERRKVRAWTWIALPSNDNFVANESFKRTIDTILSAVGTSGPNIDYVLNLDAALTTAGIEDQEVSRYAVALRTRLSESSRD